jgi:hypothetical protein
MRGDIKSGSPERAARRELNRNTRDFYNFVLGESAHQRAYVLFFYFANAPDVPRPSEIPVAILYFGSPAPKAPILIVDR